MTSQEIFGEVANNLAKVKELLRSREESIERCEKITDNLYRVVTIYKPAQLPRNNPC